jgi:penicillin-binding protein 1C
MLLDASTMEVLAQVGSADFFDNEIHGQIDGTRCKRSPGSTLKPFVYAMALDQGLIHPLSILVDAPHSFGTYTPENFDREFAGPVRASDALTRSRNIPAIALSSQLSKPDLYDLLKSAQVDLPHEKGFYGLTLPIGGAEVTLQDLVRLYAALANNGRLRPLRRTLADPATTGTRMFSPEAAFLTLEMLATNGPASQGSGDPENPVFWKTGTSNGFHDAWSVAVFDHYVLAVWVGNFDGRSNPAFLGRTCAGPLLFQTIDAFRANGTVHGNPHLPPSGANLRKVELCAISGQLPTDACKERVNGWFIPGISPIATCTVHRKVLLDAATGLRVARDDGTRSLRQEVYEFWPSNLLELFAQAGLPRRCPPPFLPGYEAEPAAITAGKGKALRIVSPKPGQVYALRAVDDESRRLALKAETESDVALVYWFSGKQFLGASRRETALTWKPSAGNYTVIVLDDHGRSASVSLTVQSADGQ